MKNFKAIIVALISGVCAILCVSLSVNGLVTYKRTSTGGISATGSTSKDFTSDLIVWRGSFSAEGQTTKEAYKEIKKEAEIIRKYLLDNGVSENEIIFNAVNIEKQYNYEYNNEGSVIAEHLTGYQLNQEVSVTSEDVDKVEGISRDITKLIETGVDFISQPPEYYYTKLDELKLEMIELATQNAKARIDKIAGNSSSKVGKLVDASLGVFQITAQNSSDEAYSYGGTFNTSSKEKTATVTVRLNYAID